MVILFNLSASYLKKKLMRINDGHNKCGLDERKFNLFLVEKFVDLRSQAFYGILK